MACYKPLIAFRGPVGKSGKASIVFDRKSAVSFRELELPCGRCIGCRLERSRVWAIRCVHESQLHSQNCVITLTYDNDHLPADESVHVDHFQLFMKRLRKRIAPVRVRFFHCGEYGEESVDESTGEVHCARPHYHACLFGWDFPDKVEVGTSKTGTPLYLSKLLTHLWGQGAYECQKVGVLDFESAAYVARYITKKITGSMAEDHYQGRKPEYVTMSRGRRPDGGIGFRWYQKFSSDVFPNDHVIVRGRVCKPPRYYFEQLESSDPVLAKHLKMLRDLDETWAERDTRRAGFAVGEEVARARARRFKRTMEE